MTRFILCGIIMVTSFNVHTVVEIGKNLAAKYYGKQEKVEPQAKPLGHSYINVVEKMPRKCGRFLGWRPPR